MSDSRDELERLARLIHEAENPPERGLLLRVFWGLLWFVPLVVTIDLLLIFLVGSMAAARSEEGGMEAGGAAAGAFFTEYGALILAAQVMIWAGLCLGGWLPGTSRQRKPRGTGRER